MALTLVEAAKQTKDPLATAIIEIFAKSTGILRVLPFNNIEGNALKYNLEEALGGIGFRGVNESFDESTGVINPMIESLVIAGGDLDVDKFIIKTQGGSQRSTQEAMKVKHLAHKWSQVFIKGDSEVNLREFDGLQKRLGGNQLVSSGTTSGGDPLSLAKLDELIDTVDDANALLVSKAQKRLLTAAARDTTVGGFISYAKDEFGRTITMYNDLPLIVMDENGAVYPTLQFDEAAEGGGNSASSMYAVHLGEGMLSGIQNGGIDVNDLGELDDKPVLRTRVEWYNGVSMEHPRAAGRLYGISNAAVIK